MTTHKHDWHLARFTESAGLVPLEEGVVMLAPHIVEWVCKCGKYELTEYQVATRIATEFIMPEASPSETPQQTKKAETMHTLDTTTQQALDDILKTKKQVERDKA